MRPLPRSFLFLPANRAEFVAKAPKYGPHAVILDLEDSVPDAQLPEVSARVRSHTEHLREHGIAPWVRLSGPGESGLRDVAQVVSRHLAGLIVPKAEHPDEIREIDRQLAWHEGAHGIPCGTIELIVMPETAAGIHDAHALAKAGRRVRGLMSGVTGAVAGDVARAVGYEATPEALEQLYMQGKIVLDSRAAGAQHPIAGVVGFPNADLAAIEAAIRRAKSVGFSGVALVHPSHVAIANRVFALSSAEVAHCAGIVEAYRRAVAEGKGAVVHEGVMIDKAMAVAAEQMLKQGRDA